MTLLDVRIAPRRADNSRASSWRYAHVPRRDPTGPVASPPQAAIFRRVTTSPIPSGSHVSARFRLRRARPCFFFFSFATLARRSGDARETLARRSRDSRRSFFRTTPTKTLHCDTGEVRRDLPGRVSASQRRADGEARVARHRAPRARRSALRGGGRRRHRELGRRAGRRRVRVGGHEQCPADRNLKSRNRERARARHGLGHAVRRRVAGAVCARRRGGEGCRRRRVALARHAAGD